MMMMVNHRSSNINSRRTRRQKDVTLLCNEKQVMCYCRAIETLSLMKMFVQATTHNLRQVSTSATKKREEHHLSQKEG